MTLLRRALGALPVTSPGVEVTTVRIRILITLSYGEAETGSVQDGLAHLSTAGGLIATLPEGPDAVGLRAIVQGRQALILHRAGRTAEAIALYYESVRQLEDGRASGAVGTATLSTALMNRGVDQHRVRPTWGGGAGHAPRHRPGGGGGPAVDEGEGAGEPRRHRAPDPARAARSAERLNAVGLTDEAAVATLLAVRMAIRRGNPAAARVLLDLVPAPGPITPIDHRMLLRLCRAELAVAVGEPGSALREAEEGLAELGRVRDRMGGLDLLCGTAVHGA